jgi:LytS/YehU family sensor histidine kinase
MERLIPSLTLEILVENAIKHNQLSKKAPLVVDIYLENDCLIVKNNLQLRSDTGHSHGIGLTNLSERLRLLGVHNARFEKTNDHFIASIPTSRCFDFNI